MNKLRSAIKYVFIGAAISVGFTTVLLVGVHLQQQSIATPQKLSPLVESDVAFSNSRMVRVGTNLSFATEIKNTSGKHLKDIYLQAQLFDDTGFFGECWKIIESLRPGQALNIVIKCSNYPSANIPKSSTFKIQAIEAQYANEA